MSKIRHYSRQLSSCSCNSWFTDEKLSKHCFGCTRSIATRAVRRHQNIIKDQEWSILNKMNIYQMGPVPIFKKLPLGFTGIFFGFDSQSYAYIRHPENELLMKQEYYGLQIELDKFYSSNQHLRQFSGNPEEYVVDLGELYAFEVKPGGFMRVQIICVSNRSNVILAVNVDTGKIYHVEVVQLFQPTKIFFKLPFQVIRCKLFDLEPFLDTSILMSVWKKMGKKLKYCKMTIVKMGVIPSLVLLAEDSIITINSAIRNALEKYSPCQESYKESIPTATPFILQQFRGARPTYPGSRIEFFPNNFF